MTITVQVRDYRAVASADIEIDRVALIQAKNRGGKSSIMWAVRGAMLGQAAPDKRSMPEGWDKADLKDLVRGKGPAVANVFGDDAHGRKWSARMTWPDGKHETNGQVPVLSPIAAGIWGSALTNLKTKDRAATLSGMLVSKVSIEDFKAAIEAKEETIVAVHKLVEASGFDVAHTRAQEKLTAKKRQWEEITGSRFGDVKYVDWRPEGWNADLEALSLEVAKAALEGAQTLENEAIAGGAVAADRVAMLKQSASQLEVLRGLLKSAENAEFDVASELQTAKTAVANLPASEDEDLACPHCGETVAYVAGKLVKSAGDKLTAGELKQRRAMRASAEGKVQNLTNKHKQAISAVAVARRDVELAEKATVALDEIKAKQSDVSKVAEARVKVDLAKANLRLVNQVANAKIVAAQVKVSLSTVAGLAPSGIRHTVLMREIEAFNKRLASISEDFGIPTVRFDDTFELWEGPRKFKNESGSDQHRIGVVLQIAIAELDGSPFVVIDSDSDWDRSYYNGLLKTLLKRKMPALVSVRANRIEDAINPFKINSAAVQQLVRGYWIDESGNALLLQKPAES